MMDQFSPFVNDLDLTCPVVKGLGFYHFSELSSALVLLLSQNNVDGFISNISVGSSFHWYMLMTPFETVMFGLIMLQIVVLRYLEILPININNLFALDPSGRKKRGAPKKVCDKDNLAESIFRILHKLDVDDCLPLSLCELQLQSQSASSLKLPKQTKNMLAALNMFGKRRQRSEECQGSALIALYENAVLLGNKIEYANSTDCEQRYHGCSLSKSDIIHYVNVIVEADML